jgi:DNA-binding protein H-NS
MAKARAARKTESTYAELQKQIEDLTIKAQAVRQQEVAGVVERIREAISVYGLTPEQLFGQKSAPKARAVRVKAEKKNKAVDAKAAAPKAAPKYRDPASGKTWTGNGKRPGWFVAAVEAGTDPQTLAV